jgi:hypothetical protein
MSRGGVRAGYQTSSARTRPGLPAPPAGEVRRRRLAERLHVRRARRTARRTGPPFRRAPAATPRETPQLVRRRPLHGPPRPHPERLTPHAAPRLASFRAAPHPHRCCAAECARGRTRPGSPRPRGSGPAGPSRHLPHPHRRAARRGWVDRGGGGVQLRAGRADRGCARAAPHRGARALRRAGAVRGRADVRRLAGRDLAAAGTARRGGPVRLLRALAGHQPGSPHRLPLPDLGRGRAGRRLPVRRRSRGPLVERRVGVGGAGGRAGLDRGAAHPPLADPLPSLPEPAGLGDQLHPPACRVQRTELLLP